MPSQRVRRLLQVGIVACLSLLSLPELCSGQTQGLYIDRRCQNCHGQEHIATISLQERETMVQAPESGLTERENPAALYIDQDKLSRSIHGETACVDCHIGAEVLPHPARLPSPQCMSCHKEEAQDVSGSRHAEMRQRSEPPAPYCWDCHGAHEIVSQAETNPLDKIRICASCHQTHSGQIEGVENGALLVRSYLDSVHGQNIGEPGDPEVGATCEDCHGHHRVLPINDPRSPVHRRNISATCGNCHPEIHDEFEETVHADVAHGDDPTMRPAVCINCHTAHHTAHSITHAGTPEFTRDLVNECGSCHENLYRTYLDTYHGQVQQLGGERVAKCGDCHGTHNIRRPKDPKSLLSASNRAATCSRCHEEIKGLSVSARANFIAYHPHADFRDRNSQPGLFWIWRLTLVSCVIVFALWALHFLALVRRKFTNKSKQAEGEPDHAILRFKALHRWIHLSATACVLVLAFTGLPLKFSRQPWIKTLMTLFGGPDTVVFLHRTFAVILIGIAIFYGVSVWIGRGKQRQPLRKKIVGPNSLWPRLGDFGQFSSMLRWSAGRGSRPALDRWSYREKFDYWALVITVGALTCSGLFIWFPTFFARFLSGYWFNVAMVVHSSAGLLAIGFALMIHILNSSLGRVGFPVNDVIFTGRLSEKELQEERPAQYERLAKEGTLDRLRAKPVSDRNRKIAFYATLASQVLAVGIFILIILAVIF